MSNKIIFLYSLITVAFLFVLGQLLPSSYYVTLLAKLALFLIVPLMINRFIIKETLHYHISKASLKYILPISSLIIVSIIAVYYLVASQIDISLIKEDFLSRQKITTGMYLIPVLYTIFINSFMEELFFRGFIFQGFKGHKGLAAVFSSLLFAIYHIGIFAAWFSLPIMLLALTGLFLGGLIFSYAVHKTGSLLASYLIHMSADIGVVIVGVFMMRLFV